jgi:hypothetical protein
MIESVDFPQDCPRALRQASRTQMRLYLNEYSRFETLCYGPRARTSRTTTCDHTNQLVW